MRLKPQAYAEDQVLVVHYQDDHVVAIEDERNKGRPDGELQIDNALIFTIRDELSLDHYFVPEHNVVLVRINHATFDNEVLKYGGA